MDVRCAAGAFAFLSLYGMCWREREREVTEEQGTTGDILVSPSLRLSTDW